MNQILMVALNTEQSILVELKGVCIYSCHEMLSQWAVMIVGWLNDKHPMTQTDELIIVFTYLHYAHTIALYVTCLCLHQITSSNSW